jgi:hypothetical protein
MRRREFSTMLAGAAVCPLMARAQEQSLNKLLALADEVID